MLRFALSPTADMHIDDLRIALLTYIIAKQKNEDFIIRIDDIDTKNNIEGRDQEILDLLDLFGIEYNQVIYQSQNFRFHSAMALQLLHDKKAFSCFCSDEWLEKKKSEAERKKIPYLYDDACANLPAELVIDNTNPFTVRLKKPLQNIIIKNHLQDDTIFDAKNIDSFVIMNRDKTSTNIFASAIDDMLNDISLVVQSEILLEDIPKQNHIRSSLNYDKKIEYISIIPSSTKSLTIKELLEKGFLPEAIINYIILLEQNENNKIFSLKDAISFFDISKITISPLLFNIKKLEKINKEHLKNMEDKELSRYVGFADDAIGKIAKVYLELEEVSTTKELRKKIEMIFQTKEIPQKFQKEAEIIKNLIKTIPYCEEYSDFKYLILEKSDIDENNFELVLQFLLIGSNDKIEIDKIYTYLKGYIGEIIK